MHSFSHEDDEHVSPESASRVLSNPGSDKRTRPLKDRGEIDLIELQPSHESRSLLSRASELPDQLENVRPDGPVPRSPLRAKWDTKLESTSKLYRRPYILILVLLYCCIILPGWVILCTLKNRPITAQSYSENFNSTLIGVFAAEATYDLDPHRYKKNERWYRAARVLIAIANNLIIPLTSTVCASAAVIYVQHMGRRSQLSMTHTTTLADRGWTSPLVYLSLLTKKGWKSRGSGFLYFCTCTVMFGRLKWMILKIFSSSTRQVQSYLLYSSSTWSKSRLRFQHIRLWGLD